MEEQNLIPFEGKEIRKIWHDGEWYFSVIDIVEVLTDSPQPSSYWNKVKKTILKENQSLRFWQKLKLKSSDSKNYLTDVANIEAIFRIVMSIPSFKAEPLKLWLAEQGKRTIDEAENPELLTERQAELYRAKGYSEEWITRRVQTIETRKALTDEWKQRGVNENQEYAILTATIAKKTFGLTPSEHKDIKGLERQNLRDHMTPLELIFTALSEETVKILAVDRDTKGFSDNYDAASDGGRMAGDARKNYEKSLGKSVISSANFLNPSGNNEMDTLPSDGDKSE